MTKFVKEQFTSGEYAMYNGRFVARFKRGGRASFLSFLVKNFTVEEYFQKLEGEKMAPLTILESKGYLLPHIKKWLKEGGYEVTPAGFRKMIEDQISARQAKA
jgi:hypothetical protein